MTHEPEYQIYGPTKAEVVEAINNTYFIKKLYKSNNSYEENETLMKHYSITFESIRLVKDWEEKVNTIINQEVDKEDKKGMGSYRGYYTFVHNILCSKIQERIVREIWGERNLSIKLNIIKNNWLKKRYSPGGAGFLEAKTHFETLAIKQ